MRRKLFTYVLLFVDSGSRVHPSLLVEQEDLVGVRHPTNESLAEPLRVYRRIARVLNLSITLSNRRGARKSGR